MVKIDGDKVRQLREQKGLTQLYVATVVQVTTDTISRWENKRYPTIKKENGIRLAEALEVPLEDILMVDEDPTPDSDTAPRAGDEYDEQQAGPLPAHPRFPLIPILFFFLIAGAASVAAWYYLMRTEDVTLEARRIVPQVCTLGQPFPVAIEVNISPQSPLAIIVKEQVPEGVVVKATDPPLPDKNPKNNSLKWLKKIEGKVLFSYIAVAKDPAAAGKDFSGTVATGNDGGISFPITGPHNIRPTTFHWADANGDNVINDQEILAVYDQYGDLEQLGLDIDLIEEIWLGSGYSWNEKKKTYDILP